MTSRSHPDVEHPGLHEAHSTRVFATVFRADQSLPVDHLIGQITCSDAACPTFHDLSGDSQATIPPT